MKRQPTRPRPKPHVPSGRMPAPAAPSHAEVRGKLDGRAMASDSLSTTADDARALASMAAAARRGGS